MASRPTNPWHLANKREKKQLLSDMFRKLGVPESKLATMDVTTSPFWDKLEASPKNPFVFGAPGGNDFGGFDPSGAAPTSMNMPLGGGAGYSIPGTSTGGFGGLDLGSIGRAISGTIFGGGGGDLFGGSGLTLSDPAKKGRRSGASQYPRKLPCT